MAPDLARLIRWAQARRLLHARLEDDLGYALHGVLRAAFDTLAPAPFALIRHPSQAASLLAYSPHSAIALRAQATACAEPDAMAAIGLRTLASKALPERFPAGLRLRFALRARPIVRTDRDGNRNRTRERDAFLAAIATAEPGREPSRGDVYSDWLTARLADGGAQTAHLVLDAFRVNTTLRRDSERTLRAFSGPEADFRGELVVADPERFSGMLAGGVGRHRAFGFGMLLLQPVLPAPGRRQGDVLQGPDSAAWNAQKTQEHQESACRPPSGPAISCGRRMYGDASWLV